MPNCSVQQSLFPALKRRRIEASFSGGEITSDGGVFLLRQVDRHLGLSEIVFYRCTYSEGSMVSDLSAPE